MIPPANPLAIFLHVVKFMHNRVSFQFSRILSHQPSGRLLARSLILGFATVALTLCTGVSNLFAEDAEPLKELPRAVLRHTPPIFEEWTFEKHLDAALPPGFSSHTLGDGYPGEWTIITDDGAPSRTHALLQPTSCSKPGCYQLLINDTIHVEYLDLSVGMLSQLGTPTAAAGLILNFQDLDNFYAVIVYPASNMLKAYRFDDGKPVLIKEHEVLPKKRTPWHFLRVQRNTIVSKDFFEISFDNQFFLSVYDSKLRTGRIGIMTTGDGKFAFDNLRVVELVTSEPLSRPPAY